MFSELQRWCDERLIVLQVGEAVPGVTSSLKAEWPDPRSGKMYSDTFIFGADLWVNQPRITQYVCDALVRHGAPAPWTL